VFAPVCYTSKLVLQLLDRVNAFLSVEDVF